MQQFKDTHELLQIKKLESPGEHYFENFLSNFQSYQRQQILQRETTWHHLRELWNRGMDWAFTPAHSLALAGAAAAVLALASFVPHAVTPEASSHQIALLKQTSEESPSLEQDSIARIRTYPRYSQTQTASLNLPNRDYGDPFVQQPEIQTVSSTEHDLSSPRYVTGEAVAPYDTTLSF